MSFWNLKNPPLSDTSPPPRPCILILPKQFANWEPNIQTSVYGGHSHSNCHSILTLLVLFLAAVTRGISLLSGRVALSAALRHDWGWLTHTADRKQESWARIRGWSTSESPAPGELPLSFRPHSPKNSCGQISDSNYNITYIYNCISKIWEKVTTWESVNNPNTRHLGTHQH